jgi:putative hydrolase of the HAD superfamily
MRLDGIVLDLDDTLFDTTRRLLPWADRRAVAAMRRAGLDLDEETALRRLLELRRAGVVRTFAALAAERDASTACVAAGEDAWFDYDPPPMTLEPSVDRALDELAETAPLALFTLGHVATQRRKVERLGLARRFVDVRYVDFRGKDGKTEALASILVDRGWTPSRVVVCGDRPDGDVRSGNRNGCLTVLVRRDGGEFAAVAPASPDDVPWRTIAHVAELPALLNG